jgi:hypothetical protein
MVKGAEQALEKAKELAELVNKMIPDARDWDLQRLLKQIEADLMDVQHKISMAVKLSLKE